MEQPDDKLLASVPLVDANKANVVSREKLSQIKPGFTTLPEVYTQLGYPTTTRVFPLSIALRYPSEADNLPHVVLLDRRSGKVQLVALYNHLEAYSLNQLEKQYGTPELAETLLSHEYWFFIGEGAALITEGRGHKDILYVQILPPDMTMDTYQKLQGYSFETFAFTPSEFKTLAPDLSEAASTPTVCPLCGAMATRGCLYGADKNQLHWFSGEPNALNNVISFFGGGTPVGQWDFLIGPYIEGIRCTECGKIILSG